METRTQTQIYLLGSTVTELLGPRLPSNRQVYGLFLHYHVTEKLTIRNAATTVIEEVKQFWERARIPVRDSQHCICKLEKLFNEWKVLKKHKNRETSLHKQQVAEFVENLENLFDIAHADALSMIKIAEDRAFLLAQREKGRRGMMGPVDQMLAAREKRVQEAAKKEEQRRLKAKEYALEMSSMTEVAYSFSSCEDNTDDDSPSTEGAAAEGCPKKKKLRRATKNIITPGLAAALDRTGISSRRATFVLAEAAKSFGHDTEDITINRMSIHRQRKQHRAKFVEEFKAKFPADIPLIIHWDGKLLEDLTSKQHVNRLPLEKEDSVNCWVCQELHLELGRLRHWQ